MILNASKEDFEKSQVAQYFVDSKDLKGAIILSANFEPLPIAISAERATIALAHVAHNSVQRTIRMDEDRFSGLPRYLTAESNKNGHNFGATEDSMVSIYAENVDLANPVSMDGSPVEGNIEDTASNLPRIAERLQRASSNIIDLYAMELLHATQAIDLRRAQQDGMKLAQDRGSLQGLPRQGSLRRQGPHLLRRPGQRHRDPEELALTRTFPRGRSDKLQGKPAWSRRCGNPNTFLRLRLRPTSVSHAAGRPTPSGTGAFFASTLPAFPCALRPSTHSSSRSAVSPAFDGWLTVSTGFVIASLIAEGRLTLAEASLLCGQLHDGHLRREPDRAACRPFRPKAVRTLPHRAHRSASRLPLPSGPIPIFSLTSIFFWACSSAPTSPSPRPS